MARALEGLATPESKFRGELVKRKVQRLSALHVSDSFSRSQLSPIGIPQPLRNTSWQETPQGLGDGHASYAVVSLATAANWQSQCHLIISFVASTPTNRLSSLLASCTFWSCVRWLYSSTHPVRIIKISPGMKTILCNSATSSSCCNGIA